MRWVGLVLVAGLLAACGPGDTRKFELTTSPEPGAELQRTFSGCAWGEAKGAHGLSIWSFACGPQFGNVRLVADDALPGFVLEATGPEGMDRRPAIRIFPKPAVEPIDAILPAVRAASTGPATATCVFEPAPGVDHVGGGDFVLAPTGDAKAAYDAAISSDQMPEPPCGALGVSGVGDRVFRVLAGDSESVAWIDFGSEIQIFDATTLKRGQAAPRH